MSEEEIEIGLRPESKLEGSLWDMALKNLVDYMYQDIPYLGSDDETNPNT